MTSLVDALSAVKKLSPAAKNVKIAVLDIESKPLLAYTWGLWKQNIGIQQIVEQGGLLCLAWKWHGKAGTEFASEWGDGYTGMLEKAHALLSEADIVVTYNGARYDLKKLDQAFMLAGMSPPSPFKHIDLFKTNKGRFDLPSRKLDYLAQQTGQGGKTPHTGIRLWLDVMAGDVPAQKRMEKYNRNDVVITSKVYDRVRPWIKDHPHLSQFTGEDWGCPNCGHADVRPNRDGEAYSFVQKYPKYQCPKCGTWIRGTRKLKDATQTRYVQPQY